MALLPSFERLDGSFVMQRLLRYSVVVQPDEAVQRLLQVFGAMEVVRVEHLRDAPVKALDHAVGLRVFGFCEPVLDAQRLAQRIEAVLGRRGVQTKSWTT